MILKEMDRDQLIAFLTGGARYLAANKEEINALNVFPVPDGDTGINMYLTISSAVKNIEDAADNPTVTRVVQNFSMGALMGARGNSGVILSQIFRGFAQGLRSKETVNAPDLAAAFQKGVDLSYKSVMKPVEGTILTVFRLFAAAANQYVKDDDDIIGMLKFSLEQGEKALNNTPNLLPVLKKAGVVDAGGKGIMVIMEGGLKVLLGEEIPVTVSKDIREPVNAVTTSAAAAMTDEIKYIYCTELMIKGKDISSDEIRNYLDSEIDGDSLVVVGMNDIVKVHYHSNCPWRILEYAGRFGELYDIKIDNMRKQHKELVLNTPVAENGKPEVKARCGVLAVCAGDGMTEIFNKMGAYVISGGQTMNPSAEDLLKAVKEFPVQEVIILPNNKNIILTAHQVEKMTKKPVRVIESKYVTQGLATLLPFNKDDSLEENYSRMNEVLSEVRSGEITYAVRDSNYDGLEIAANDILALYEGKIIDTEKEVYPALLKLTEKMVEDFEDASIVSFFYGNGLEKEDAEDMMEKIGEHFPDLDIEYRYGGQPLYYFLISIE